MKSHKRIEVSNTSSIHTLIWTPERKKINKCVIFSHGFSVSGYESRRMFLDIADRLVNIGIMCVLFDYRGSGYSDWDFSQMTIDSEIEDLNLVIDATRKEIESNISICIWGMSFGAGVASIVAAQRNDIDSILIWCLSADLYDRYKERLGDEIFSNGFVYNDKGFKVTLAFLESLKDKDVHASFKNIYCPILFVHGDEDKTASVELSKKAFLLANEPKQLEIIQGGVHGFKFQTDLYELALSKSISWLIK